MHFEGIDCHAIGLNFSCIVIIQGVSELSVQIDMGDRGRQNKHILPNNGGSQMSPFTARGH